MTDLLGSPWTPGRPAVGGELCEKGHTMAPSATRCPKCNPLKSSPFFKPAADDKPVGFVGLDGEWQFDPSPWDPTPSPSTLAARARPCPTFADTVYALEGSDGLRRYGLSPRDLTQH